MAFCNVQPARVAAADSMLNRLAAAFRSTRNKRGEPVCERCLSKALALAAHNCTLRQFIHIKGADLWT